MNLSSKTFSDGQRMPKRCAFGIPADDGPMQLGPNRNPHLAWSDVPDGAASLVLICVDPDAPSVADDVNVAGRSIPEDLPRADFTHWSMVDIDPRSSAIEEGSCSFEVTVGGKSAPPGPAGCRQGPNDYTGFLASDPDLKGAYSGYDGPCPPWNDERLHHYRFTLYALDVACCEVSGNFSVADIKAAIAGHVLAEASITGTYTLNPKLATPG